MPYKISVISVDMSPNECIPNVEIRDSNNDVIATVYGERNAKIFAEAEEAYEILKRLVEDENPNYDYYKYARELIDRVENSPELTCDGLTMTDLLEKVVKGK